MLRCTHCGGNLRAEEDYEWRSVTLKCLACGRSPSVMPVKPIATPVRDRPTRVCEQCGKPYVPQDWHKHRQRFCSHSCGIAGRVYRRKAGKGMTVCPG